MASPPPPHKTYDAFAEYLAERHCPPPKQFTLPLDPKGRHTVTDTSPFTERELKRVLAKLLNFRATGTDKINAELLRAYQYGVPIHVRPLHDGAERAESISFVTSLRQDIPVRTKSA